MNQWCADWTTNRCIQTS